MALCDSYRLPLPRQLPTLHFSVTDPDVAMWWHLTAAELECGVIDETVEYVGGEIDWKRKMDGYRDWMRHHPESRAVWETARFGAPLPRK